jgi:GH24 family phage-related lysozyme (muramidase)
MMAMSRLAFLRPGVLNFLWETYQEEAFENTIRELYKDRLGRRTIGVGVLLDCDIPGQKGSYTRPDQQAKNLAAVLKMKFVKVDPSTGKATRLPASREDVIKDWNDAGKIDQKVVNAQKQTTRLRRPRVLLDEAEVRRLFDKMNGEHLAVMSKFSWYQDFLLRWPADAQLGILAIAYAGPGMLSAGQTFGKVARACKAGRFDEAAKECLRLSWGKLHRRRFIAKCFEAADYVLANKKSEDCLYVRSFLADAAK